jgi:hypothetical protein
MINAYRETVTTVLNQFRDARLLEIDRTTITLVNLARLRERPRADGRDRGVRRHASGIGRYARRITPLAYGCASTSCIRGYGPAPSIRAGPAPSTSGMRTTTI